MKIQQNTWWIIGGVSTALIISAGFYIRYKGKQKKLANATDTLKGQTASTTSNTKTEPNWNKPFDMNYLNDVMRWTTPERIRILDDATAKQYARVIKNAKGFFNDNEKAIETIFSKKLQDKTQVASLSKAFYNLDNQKQDLWQYMASFLSSKELQRYVHSHVRKLPNYTLL